MTSYNSYGFRNDWQSFTRACLDISLYNHYQTGLNLAGLCKWISGRYGECIVNLGDTLHRHNLVGKTNNAEEAHRIAQKLGDQWIADNESYLAWLTIPYKIVRHDDWLNDSEFPPVHEALWDFYKSNSDFYQVVENDVSSFLERQKDAVPPFMKEASVRYLLEELAADIILGKRFGVAHFYPTTKQKCYGYLVQHALEMPDILRGLENSAVKRYSPGKLRLVSSETTSFMEIPEKRQSAA